MAGKNDFDLLETTVDTGVEITLDPKAEIDAVIDDLEALLKNGEVIGKLSGAGINASLALLAVDALRRYLGGDKAGAAEDFATVAEEIQVRRAAGSPSGGEA